MQTSVNKILKSINQGMSDEQIRKQFKLKHRELYSFKSLNRQKHTAVHVRFDDTKISLGSKRESYYTEDELLNLSHNWFTKENRLFK
jgi:hypothetical protein